MLTDKEAWLIDRVRAIGSVIVDDRQHGRVGRAITGVHRITQRQVDRVRSFDEGVINDQNRKGLGLFASTNEQRAGSLYVVLLLIGCPIAGGVINRGSDANFA